MNGIEDTDTCPTIFIGRAPTSPNRDQPGCRFKFCFGGKSHTKRHTSLVDTRAMGVFRCERIQRTHEPRCSNQLMHSSRMFSRRFRRNVPPACSHLSSTTHLAGAPRAHESMRTLSLRAGADSGACMCWQARTRADGRPHERTSAHATTASVNPCSRQKVNHSFIHSSTGPPINLHALANTLAHSEGRCGPRPWGCCAHGKHINGEKGALWNVGNGKQR